MINIGPMPPEMLAEALQNSAASTGGLTSPEAKQLAQDLMMYINRKRAQTAQEKPR